MKKPAVSILVIVTALFAAFTMGFFAGKNLNQTAVQVSAIPAPAETAVPATRPPDTEPVQEAPEASEGTKPPETLSGDTRININTATLAELDTLPGIGPVLAQRIIDYRETYGPFGSPTELLNVSGIGEKKLEAIIDLVTTGG